MLNRCCVILFFSILASGCSSSSAGFSRESIRSANPFVEIEPSAVSSVEIQRAVRPQGEVRLPEGRTMVINSEPGGFLGWEPRCSVSTAATPTLIAILASAKQGGPKVPTADVGVVVRAVLADGRAVVSTISGFPLGDGSVELHIDDVPHMLGKDQYDALELQIKESGC